MLVEPDGVGGLALGEEQQVGLDAGIGSKDAFGQADDGVQLAVSHQQFLDPGLDAFAEQNAVGQDHGGATALLLEQLLDDQGEEHVGGFTGVDVGRESPPTPSSSMPPKGGLVMTQSTLSLSDHSFQPLARVLRCSIWLGTSMPCNSMLVVQSRWGSCFFSMPRMQFGDGLCPRRWISW